MAVIDYMNRQLVHLDTQLEEETHDFKELQKHLKELFRLRRRCAHFHILLKNAKGYMRKSGPT
jgi:hypothetical protein